MKFAKYFLKSTEHFKKLENSESEVYDAISSAVARLAERIEADLIVCQTASGATATAMAAERPNMPIVTAASDQRVANQLALIYGNSAFCRKYSENYGYELEVITTKKKGQGTGLGLAICKKIIENFCNS